MAWREGDLDLAGVRIHYYRRGSGRPLVLAHGMSDNGECWTRLAEALEDECDCIAYDARFHGQSDAAAGGSQVGAGDLVGVVEGLGLDRPAMVGHSMGARTLMAAAAAHPALASCAILEDPPLRMPAASPNQPLPRFEMPDYASMTIAEIEAQGRARSPGWHPGEFGPWARSKKQFRPQAMAGLAPPGDWRHDLARMALPTLLIYGGSRERFGLVGDEAAAEARRLNPRLETLRLDEAGHNVRREAFEPFVAAIRAFLARHP